MDFFLIHRVSKGDFIHPPAASRKVAASNRSRTATMADITEDIRNFLSARQEFERRSRQIAAFRLATGVDLSTALAAEGEEKAKVIRRLGRLIERERLRGAKRHWSYDINRHIALKQVLDELCGRPARQPTGIPKRRAKRIAAPAGAAIQKSCDGKRA
jgi:hypothetical protein